MALTVFVSDGLHVQALEKLSFVHEAFEGESPSVSNSLEILSLVDIKIDEGKLSVFFGFSC